jgi:hypothetical protein
MKNGLEKKKDGWSSLTREETVPKVKVMILVVVLIITDRLWRLIS